MGARRVASPILAGLAQHGEKRVIGERNRGREGDGADS